jgi:hypothetical protein
MYTGMFGFDFEIHPRTSCQYAGKPSVDRKILKPNKEKENFRIIVYLE